MATSVMDALEQQPLTVSPITFKVGESLRFLEEDNKVCERLLNAEIAAKENAVNIVSSFIPVVRKCSTFFSLGRTPIFVRLRSLLESKHKLSHGLSTTTIPAFELSRKRSVSLDCYSTV
jgi:hypothetical protein